jgi:DMSO/TMAO reductase YedYZ molybdopterin-dependent catalytic subunit
MFTRGFFGKKRPESDRPVPPGQYLETGFPVLTAGPTPRVDLTTWQFTLEQDNQTLGKWSWEEFLALPATEMHVDIHCVTKWSKQDTDWKGVSIDTLLEAAGLSEPPADYVMAFCDGGYTANLPVEDLIDGKAIVTYEYDGEPLEPAHGGPVRLLVPHLYFWKSAKWVRGLRFMDHDAPGFWEAYGYHMYGDPWQEQRYHGD